MTAKAWWPRIHSKLIRVWRFRLRNLMFLLPRPHIQVVVEDDSQFNFAFFEWIARHHPGLYRHLRFSLSGSLGAMRLPGARVLLPWVRDPVKERSLELFSQLLALEHDFKTAGLAVVNPVANLSRARKSVALAMAQSLGIRCASFQPCGPQSDFDHLVRQLGLPFIVRDNATHTRPMYRIEHPMDLNTLPWHRLREPVACEYLDTQQGGRFRKFRCMTVDGVSLPRHLVVSGNWCTHTKDRLFDPAYLDEERRYLALPGCPFHGPLNQLRNLMGLDWVAFDFSVDKHGELVLWEPNPFPHLWDYRHPLDERLSHHHPAIHRIFNQMMLHLVQRAGWSLDRRGLHTHSGSAQTGETASEALNNEIQQRRH
ncbi:hypothetical protein [Ferrimonas balearica]|uniref:hypothetical protein n=1 Tax=Ferrimonas balearica TaxID=44012 RepID=UPI001C98FD5F|nr:hypothetical protein [Ferrimonas balearica]MBY5991824.1 hypothetical protein [Ferrimonas balearica]